VANGAKPNPDAVMTCTAQIANVAFRFMGGDPWGRRAHVPVLVSAAVGVTKTRAAKPRGDIMKFCLTCWGHVTHVIRDSLGGAAARRALDRGPAAVFLGYLMAVYRP
jgi:hypothetical protein